MDSSLVSSLPSGALYRKLQPLAPASSAAIPAVRNRDVVVEFHRYSQRKKAPRYRTQKAISPLLESEYLRSGYTFGNYQQRFPAPPARAFLLPLELS